MSIIRAARASIREDLDAAMRRDPAAETRFDVAVNSPGLHAIWAYRGLHQLWQTARRPPRGPRAVDRRAVGDRRRDPPRRADRPALLHRPRDGRRHRRHRGRRRRRDALPRRHAGRPVARPRHQAAPDRRRPGHHRRRRPRARQHRDRRRRADRRQLRCGEAGSRGRGRDRHPRAGCASPTRPTRTPTTRSSPSPPCSSDAAGSARSVRAPVRAVGAEHARRGLLDAPRPHSSASAASGPVDEHAVVGRPWRRRATRRRPVQTAASTLVAPEARARSPGRAARRRRARRERPTSHAASDTCSAATPVRWELVGEHRAVGHLHRGEQGALRLVDAVGGEVHDAGPTQGAHHLVARRRPVIGGHRVGGPERHALPGSPARCAPGRGRRGRLPGRTSRQPTLRDGPRTHRVRDGAHGDRPTQQAGQQAPRHGGQGARRDDDHPPVGRAAPVPVLPG